MRSLTDKDVSRSPSTSELSELRRILSKERIGSYERTVGGDISKAIELHMWNTIVSGAFYSPLQLVELALRNAVHDRMSETHGRSWLQNSEILRDNETRRVTKARDQLKRKKKKPTPGRVVAEMNFGFWTSLFATGYDHLWHSDLYHVFSPRPQRRDVHEVLTHLRDLRNRIAHHEPIHQLPLEKRHVDIQWIVEMLAPDAGSWVLSHSQVPEILAQWRRVD